MRTRGSLHVSINQHTQALHQRMCHSALRMQSPLENVPASAGILAKLSLFVSPQHGCRRGIAQSQELQNYRISQLPGSVTNHPNLEAGCETPAITVTAKARHSVLNNISNISLDNMTSQMAFRSGPVHCRTGQLHTKSAVFGRLQCRQGMRTMTLPVLSNPPFVRCGRPCICV